MSYSVQYLFLIPSFLALVLVGCQKTTEEGSGVKTESKVAEEDHTEAEMQNEQAMEGMSMAPDSLQRM